MDSAYKIAADNKGKGCHKRRCDVMEQHAEKIKDEMFAEAAKPLIQGLDDLYSEVKQKLEKIIQGISEFLRSFVDGNMKITMHQKKEILQSISSCLSKAKDAFHYFQVN